MDGTSAGSPPEHEARVLRWSTGLQSREQTQA